MSASHVQPWIFLRETAAMLTSITSLAANFTTPLSHSETAAPAFSNSQKRVFLQIESF